LIEPAGQSAAIIADQAEKAANWPVAQLVVSRWTNSSR